MDTLGPEPLELSDLPPQQQQEILAIVDVERSAFQIKITQSAAAARAVDPDVDALVDLGLEEPVKRTWCDGSIRYAGVLQPGDLRAAWVSRKCHVYVPWACSIDVLLGFLARLCESCWLLQPTIGS